MKYLLTAILTIISSSSLFSQQITNFGLFQQNISFYNPSATAHQTKHYGTIQYNSRLNGFQGNPTTFAAQYEKDLKKINSGIGFLMYNDKIGFSTHNIGMLQYRYSITTGEESKIMLGVSAGVFHSRRPETLFTPGNTYSTSPTDTLKSASQGKFTLNAGISYQWKGLYVGFSAMNATKPNFDRINFSTRIHYNAHVKYDFEISEKFSISPQAHIITDLIFDSNTLNVRFEHYNKFWYLAGVQNLKSLMFGAGIQFWDRLYVGYLYQHFNNTLGKNYPGHEAFVTFKINN
jgi:type IX secretion system PorP/SprF family membrane protein